MMLVDSSFTGHLVGISSVKLEKCCETAKFCDKKPQKWAILLSL